MVSSNAYLKSIFSRLPISSYLYNIRKSIGNSIAIVPDNKTDNPSRLWDVVLVHCNVFFFFLRICTAAIM